MRTPRAEDLFAAALAQPAAERAAYLAKVCGGDVELAAHLSALMVAHDGPDILMGPSVASRPTVSPDLSAIGAAAEEEKPGDSIGHYKLLQKIGEGGCGVVWMAEQDEPVRRRVALKVIKLGMDTKAVVARFAAERQALAMMDHPNIAKVLDGGATATGRPYFVMELVHGVSITRFCDDENLTTPERLQLFVQVCHAVQHAHQKGIIHRDLKPSNILVALIDGAPTPKVIDFGIAKATQGRLTDATLFTALDQVLGTPAYMSPEQAEISGMDIDTRSDIYALGVLLYELLTGKPPFEPSTLLKAGLDEVRRIIREVEPARPSTRLSTLTEADRQTIARHRRVDPAQLSTLLRTDLDWVVMKALEKNRSRRYETATGLADDIRRYLHDEPVFARPPSTWYLVQKIYRRHRTGVAAGGTMIATLVFGFVLATHHYVREKAARERAVRAEEEQMRQRTMAETAKLRAVAAESEQVRLRAQAEANEQIAQRAAVHHAHVAQFMKDMLASVGPSVAAGRDTKLLRDILEETGRRLRTELHTNPQLEAELRSTLAGAHLDLGDFVRAEEILQESLALQRRALGPDSAAEAETLFRLGRVANGLGRYDEAERWYRSAITLQEKRNDAAVTATVEALAQLLSRAGKPEEAEHLLRQRLEIDRLSVGADHPRVADALVSLGAILQRAGRLEDAETLLREAVAIRRARRTTNDALARTLQALGTVLSVANRLAEAQAILQESTSTWRKAVGSYHPDFAAALGELALVLQRQGKWAEGRELLREVVELQRNFFGERHAALIPALHALADALGGAEAETVLLQALAIAEDGKLKAEEAKTLGRLATNYEARRQLVQAEVTQRRKTALTLEVVGESAELAADLARLSRILRHQGNGRAATEVDAELTRVRDALSESERSLLTGADGNRGDVLREQHRLAEAEEAYRAELAQLQGAERSEGLNVVRTLTRLTLICLDLGKLQEAEFAAREALRIARTLESYRGGGGVTPLHNLGAVLRRQNRLGEAESVLREALDLLKRMPNASTRNTLGHLAAVLETQHRFADIVTLWREAVDHARTRFGRESATYADYLASLATALERTENFVAAEPVARECLELRENLRADRGGITNAQSSLARALIGQGRFGEAETLLLSVHDKLGRATPGSVRTEMATVLRSLVKLYTEWDRAAVAATWRRRLADVSNRQNAPTNLSFTQVKNNFPSGWHSVGTKSSSYIIERDPQITRSTSPSLRMASREPGNNGFGGVGQTCWADRYSGHRVRLAGWIRTENVQRAQLYFGVYRDGRSIAFSNMLEQAVKGTTEWAEHDITLDVPADAEYLSFGMFISGTGTAWFGDIQLHIVDEPLSQKGEPQ